MDPKVLFVITITTARMFMPGMSGLAKMPGMNIPDMNAPKRTLTMDLTTDQQPKESYKAECAIPEDLKLGPKVNLRIDMPSEAEPSEGAIGKDDSASKSTEMKIKTYWGCGEYIAEGQPKVLDTKSMGMANQQAFKSGKMPKSMSKTLSFDNTRGYWPYDDFKGIDDKAKCPGEYNLVTNFCGDTTVFLKNNQDFLAAIDIVKPGSKGANVSKAIPIEWKSVPNAKAYLLTAFAASGNEMVTWTSSSSPDVPMDLQYKAIKKADLDSYIDKGILLPGDATSCCIPAGVFKGMQSPMLMITAFGLDKIQEKSGIETNVIIRSTASMTLGEGMQMDEDEESSDNPKEIKKSQDKDDQEDEEVENDDDNTNVVDEADKAMDQVDKTTDVINRAKNIFKRH